MNDKSNTFLDSGKGTLSALDLSLCHPSLYLDIDWTQSVKTNMEVTIFQLSLKVFKLMKKIIMQSGTTTKPTGIYFILYVMNP